MIVLRDNDLSVFDESELWMETRFMLPTVVRFAYSAISCTDLSDPNLPEYHHTGESR